MKTESRESIKLLHNLLQVQHIISGENVSRVETEGRKKQRKTKGAERGRLC